MTVESLIKSAIAGEVQNKLEPKIVEEIVLTKTERLTKQIIKKIEIEKIIKYETQQYLKSWDGQKLLKSIIAECITISLTKNEEKNE